HCHIVTPSPLRIVSHCLFSCSTFFFFSCYGDHPDLHSFPTRRSSDLHLRHPDARVHRGRRRGALGDGRTLRLHRQLHAGVLARRSEEHTSELQSLAYLVCRLLLEKKKHCRKSTAHLATAH